MACDDTVGIPARSVPFIHDLEEHPQHLTSKFGVILNDLNSHFATSERPRQFPALFLMAAGQDPFI